MSELAHSTPTAPDSERAKSLGTPQERELLQAAAFEAAVEAERARASEDLARFMGAFAALTPEQMRVQKKSTDKPVAVYPSADKWGAAALNGKALGNGLVPSSGREHSEALEAYKSKRRLGVVLAELALTESDVYGINPETGKSRVRDAAGGSLDHVRPAVRRSIKKNEKRYAKTTSKKSRLSQELEPYTPSVQNIRGQLGTSDLSGLSWTETREDEAISRRIVGLDDQQRYVVESRVIGSRDESGGAVNRYFVTEDRLDDYLRKNRSSLSAFSILLSKDQKKGDPVTVQRSRTQKLRQGIKTSGQAMASKASEFGRKTAKTASKHGLKTAKRAPGFAFQGAREAGRLYAAPQEGVKQTPELHK